MYFFKVQLFTSVSLSLSYHQCDTKILGYVDIWKTPITLHKYQELKNLKEPKGYWIKS